MGIIFVRSVSYIGDNDTGLDVMTENDLRAEVGRWLTLGVRLIEPSKLEEFIRAQVDRSYVTLQSRHTTGQVMCIITAEMQERSKWAGHPAEKLVAGFLERYAQELG